MTPKLIAKSKRQAAKLAKINHVPLNEFQCAWYSTAESDKNLEACLVAAQSQNQSQVIRHALRLGSIVLQNAEPIKITSARIESGLRTWWSTPDSETHLSECCTLLGTTNKSLVIRFVLSKYPEWLAKLYGEIRP